MQKRNSYLERFNLNQFKNHLLENDRSIRTIETYLDNVILYIDYSKQMELDDFDPNRTISIDLIEYRSFCIRNGNSPSSVNIKMSSLSAYFRFMYESNLIEKNPAASLKKLKQPSVSQIDSKVFDEKTFRAIRRLVYREGHPQHIMIFEVLSKCGLRASELCDLKMTDIQMNFEVEDSRTGALAFYGKGKIFRQVPMHRDVRQAAKKLYDFRTLRSIKSDYVFTTERSEKMSVSCLRSIIKAYHRQIGVSENYSIHSYRHYFATTLMMQNVGIIEISKLLGHKNAAITTQIYTTPSLSHLADCIEKL